MRQAACGKPEGWERPFLPGILLVFPPDRTRAKVDRLRWKLDPDSAAKVPAHITVTQPFRDQPDDEAFARVRDVLAGFEPFEVKYGPLRNFLPCPCIWFRIEPTGMLVEMRRALHATGLFNTDLPHTDDFIPHMSVTDGKPCAEETEELFRDLRGKVRGGRFKVDRLAYTRPDWQLRFLTVAELPLGKPAR